MSLDNYGPGHLNLVVSRLKYMMYVLVLDIIFLYWFAEIHPGDILMLSFALH